MRRIPRLSLLLSLLALGSCFLIKRTEISLVENPPPGEVESPVRVFMADGSLVRFPDGLTVGPDSIHGAGIWHDFTRTESRPTTGVSLDSVIGMETYDESTQEDLTVLASLGATAVVVLGGLAIACAADPKCFGSCPTIYSHGANGERLEAEAFSYSISPLLEGTDVDRLSVEPDEDGRLTLEVRNEALETHFINHLALEVVHHEADETVLPDPAGVPLVVGPLREIDAVVDRDGRDLSEVLAREDDRIFASAPGRLEAASAEDSRDWLELTLPPVQADTVALAFTLRNSLLNTILFYDLMLASQGAKALDWLGRDIERIGTAVDLGRWYRRTMGLWIEVQGPTGWTEVTRIPDTGPIAWKQLAVPVPVVPGRPTPVRLSFLVDEWRIDRISWSDRAREGESVTVPLQAVTLDDGSAHEAALDRLQRVDDRYFVTSAGAAFHVTFDAGPLPAGIDRTVLLRSQGYYTEWIRPDWVRAARDPVPFEPTDATVGVLFDRWRAAKDGMEASFHRTRIPVR